MKTLLASALLFSVSWICSGQERLLIAAASDLKFALDSIVLQFSNTHPGKVDVTYGSSGKLSEQIANGAPFDLFFSADVAYAEKLKREGKASSDIFCYAKGRIVIWSRKIDPEKNGMNALLDPSIKKIAIANPLHAPYGKRAQEAIEFYKLPVKHKLVFGDNISQAAQFISSGAADIGIIALSLALSPNMREKGKYYLIPEDSHEALVQGAIVTTAGREKKLAADFFTYIKRDSAKAILKHFGFSEP